MRVATTLLTVLAVAGCLRYPTHDDVRDYYAREAEAARRDRESQRRCGTLKEVAKVVVIGALLTSGLVLGALADGDIRWK